MHKIHEYIEKYLEKHAHEPEKREKFSKFIENFFSDMDGEYEEIAIAFEEDLEEFTDEIDEEMLIAITDNLKKRDGTVVGKKWTKEETENVCHQYDVKNKVEAAGKEYDSLCFWFAMNYVYATHHNVNRTTAGYVELAIDEITNKNICFHDIIKRMFKKI